MRKLFNDFGLYFAWLVAIVATSGSLYFSEVRALLALLVSKNFYVPACHHLRHRQFSAGQTNYSLRLALDNFWWTYCLLARARGEYPRFEYSHVQCGCALYGEIRKLLRL
jgi:hypothetical protein